jgi:hypothetical protein
MATVGQVPKRALSASPSGVEGIPATVAWVSTGSRGLSPALADRLEIVQNDRESGRGLQSANVGVNLTLTNVVHTELSTFPQAGCVSVSPFRSKRLHFFCS